MIINMVISSLMSIIATIDTEKQELLITDKKYTNREILLSQEESNQLRLFITEYISKDKQS